MNTIPSCLDDSFIRADPCWDFIYSPNTSATAQSIAENIRLNNAGRVISADAVLGFASMQDANTFLAANPERVQGGIHFLLDANAVTTAPTDSLDYVLQVNSTTKYFKDRFQDPTFFSAVPIQVAADREIARYQWNASGKGDQPLNWDVSVSEYAHPNVGSVNVVGQAMGPFIFAANMFNFVLLVSFFSSEKKIVFFSPVKELKINSFCAFLCVRSYLLWWLNVSVVFVKPSKPQACWILPFGCPGWPWSSSSLCSSRC